MYSSNRLLFYILYNSFTSPCTKVGQTSNVIGDHGGGVVRVRIVGDTVWKGLGLNHRRATRRFICTVKPHRQWAQLLTMLISDTFLTWILICQSVGGGGHLCSKGSIAVCRSVGLGVRGDEDGKILNVTPLTIFCILGSSGLCFILFYSFLLYSMKQQHILDLIWVSHIFLFYETKRGHCDTDILHMGYKTMF